MEEINLIRAKIVCIIIVMVEVLLLASLVISLNGLSNLKIFWTSPYL